MRTETAEDPIGTLERFNEKVGRLAELGFAEEARGGGAIVELRKGQESDGIHIGPEEKTIQALALTLRFFRMNNEDTSLSNMATLYASLNVEPGLSKQFTDIRDQVNLLLNSPSNLSISEEGPMTHGEILDLFMHGDLVHTNDTAKVANYRAISKTPFFPLFKDDFTTTIVLFLGALKKLQRINCRALVQMRHGGYRPVAAVVDLEGADPTVDPDHR